MNISNIASVTAGMSSMAKSLQAQRMNASIIDKTLEKVSEYGGQSGKSPIDLSQFTGKGLNVDIRI